VKVTLATLPSTPSDLPQDIPWRRGVAISIFTAWAVLSFWDASINKEWNRKTKHGLGHYYTYSFQPMRDFFDRWSLKSKV